MFKEEMDPIEVRLGSLNQAAWDTLQNILERLEDYQAKHGLTGVSHTEAPDTPATIDQQQTT